MKGNLHRRLSSLDFGNARSRDLMPGFKRRYKRESDKRARVATAVRDVPSYWEPTPYPVEIMHNWVGSCNGQVVYAWVG